MWMISFVNRNTSVRTFKGHVGSVKSIRFDELRIATGAKDKIRIWDFTYQEKKETINQGVDDESFFSKSPSKDIHGISAGSNQGKEFPGTPKSVKVKVLHGTPENTPREKEKSSGSPRGKNKNVVKPKGSKENSKVSKEASSKGSKETSDVHKTHQVAESKTMKSPRESKEKSEVATPTLRVRTCLPEVIVTES